MIIGSIRSQIDQIWNAFWSGGVSNPISVIEQLTFLMFIKRLDDLHTVQERQSEDLGTPMTRCIFPGGNDDKGEPYDNLRWSRFKHFEAREMMRIMDEHVFPFLRQLGEEGSSYGQHMKDARLGFSNANLLAKVVQMLDEVPMDDRDTKGDVYEYMLGKIASAGTNGQFRTPRHIIQLMVNIMAPKPGDVICDPAAGTSGFLVEAGEYVRNHHPEILRTKETRDHFHNKMFHGFDFDPTMLRIGAMNMTLHGIENPDISYRDSLAEEHGEDAGAYSLILANPPFSGSLDFESTSKDLQKIVKTKKTEQLFIALFLRLLRIGGRSAVVVPNGILEAESSSAKAVRKLLLSETNLHAIISLPHWVFKPYASVATSIIIFTKGSATENVWFYRVDNDGFADDAQKTPLVDEELEALAITGKEVVLGNLPLDVVGKSRVISIDEITLNDYDLCPRFYLRDYEYPETVPLIRIDELFEVKQGRSAAASASKLGAYPFITTSREPKRSHSYSFSGPAICIPTVSSTGHGHAAINTIHYVDGYFDAASITAILMPRQDDVDVAFVHKFLLTHKDELLVSLMRGATNVTLNLKRLGELKIPYPDRTLRVASLKGVVHAEEKISEATRSLMEANLAIDTELLLFKSIWEK